MSYTGQCVVKNGVVIVAVPMLPEGTPVSVSVQPLELNATVIRQLPQAEREKAMRDSVAAAVKDYEVISDGNDIIEY